MSAFTLTGTLQEIFETKPITDSFQIREFVVEEVDKNNYTRIVCFQLANKKVGLIDNFATGETITVQANVESKAWTSPQGEVKHFTTLKAWDIQGQSAQTELAIPPAPAPVPPVQPTKPAPAPPAIVEEEDDDLPF